MTARLPLYTQEIFQRVTSGAWRPGGRALTRHALALCALPRGARVLDAGCGSGATLALLRESGLRAVGVDRTPAPFCRNGACTDSRAAAAQTADRSAMTDAAPRCPVLCADATALPFRPASFDAVVCECVLSLLPDPAAVLRGFARVLRPDGRLLLTDLYIRSAAASSGTPTAPSCLAGARPRAAVDADLARSGLGVIVFEDHSHALAALAAQLVWYGDPALNAAYGVGCTCGGVKHGYGMWIAQKQTIQE